MTTTEAALRDALTEVRNSGSLAQAKLIARDALSQPSPASSTAGEVRPLRWYKPSDHPCDREDALWMAMGYGGRYAIQEDGGHFIVWMADDEFTFEQGDSVDACKEIAERHWQEQIGRLRLSPSSGEPASVAVEAETLIAAGFDDYAAHCALKTESDGGFCHAYFYSDGQWRFQTGGHDLTIGKDTVRCVLTKRLYAHPPLSKPTPVEAAQDLDASLRDRAFAPSASSPSGSPVPASIPSAEKDA